MRDATRTARETTRSPAGDRPERDSPFARPWAVGHADKLSVSRLYFADFEGKTVRRLPYYMKKDFATPESLQAP